MGNDTIIELRKRIKELYDQLDEDNFKLKLKSLEEWLLSVKCHYTKGFGDAILAVLKEENSFILKTQKKQKVDSVFLSRRQALLRYLQIIDNHIK